MYIYIPIQDETTQTTFFMFENHNIKEAYMVKSNSIFTSGMLYGKTKEYIKSKIPDLGSGEIENGFKLSVADIRKIGSLILSSTEIKEFDNIINQLKSNPTQGAQNKIYLYNSTIRRFTVYSGDLQSSYQGIQLNLSLSTTPILAITPPNIQSLPVATVAKVQPITVAKPKISPRILELQTNLEAQTKIIDEQKTEISELKTEITELKKTQLKSDQHLRTMVANQKKMLSTLKKLAKQVNQLKKKNDKEQGLDNDSTEEDLDNVRSGKTFLLRTRKPIDYNDNKYANDVNQKLEKKEEEELGDIDVGEIMIPVDALKKKTAKKT